MSGIGIVRAAKVARRTERTEVIIVSVSFWFGIIVCGDVYRRLEIVEDTEGLLYW
jgi:hypothetical protein